MIGFLPKFSKKLGIKWNFELTVFELTVPDLYQSIHKQQMNKPDRHQDTTRKFAARVCQIGMKVSFYYTIFTARKRSLGQGNFSEAFVCPQGERGVSVRTQILLDRDSPDIKCRNIHKEACSTAAQTSVYNSILRPRISMRSVGFLCSWHWLLIDLNVTRNCVPKFAIEKN